MTPVSGFWEYGIAAILGIVGMMFFVGCCLVADGAPRRHEIFQKPDEDSSVTEVEPLRKAA